MVSGCGQVVSADKRHMLCFIYSHVDTPDTIQPSPSLRSFIVDFNVARFKLVLCPIFVC